MRLRIDEYKHTILIADSDDLSRDLAEALLKNDFNILMAKSGEEALELIERNHKMIDCIILGLDMPGISGTKVLETIKASRTFSSIPVSIVTSHNTKEEERECLEKGAIDFVTKPYDGQLLRRRINNIVDLHKSSSQLSEIEIDEATGAYTRAAFYFHVKEFFAKTNEAFDLIIGDIVDFKLTNEKYGERVGFDILKYTADFIKNELAYDKFVGRFATDKFVALVQKGYVSTENIINEKLISYSNNAPIKGLRCQFGIYENVDGSQFALCTSYTMSALKKISREYEINTTVFNENIREERIRLGKLTDSMEDAITNEDFKVYFQPKHETVSGKLVGAEALIRWNHSEFGLISPAEFIPLFETNGFISRADLFVWNKTAEYLRSWIDKGLNVVPISVNASKLDFELENIEERLRKPVEELNLNPNLLHIEITETMENRDVNKLIRILSSCRDYGFRVELDDFGSGYSSLNILGSLPLDVVKIDQSFIRQIDDPRKARILTSCIALTKNLGLVSVCEGVETEEQRNILKAIGCDRIQGYYFSKPLPAEEFEKYLINEQNRNIEQDFVQYSKKTSAYVVDKEYKLISFNQMLKEEFPNLKEGEYCFKAIRGRKEPCRICPIANDQKGPKTIVDMDHNRFLIIDGTDMPIKKDEDGHLVTIGYTKNLF